MGYRALPGTPFFVKIGQMKLHWVDYWQRVTGGRLYGYTVSAQFLRLFLLGEGVELTESADTAIHYCHPFLYRPIAGKRNLIFTMHESPDLDKDFMRAFENCDGILTPSQFCADVFRKWQRVKPVRVSPLGYSELDYTFKERARPKVISGSIDETCDKLDWYIDEVEKKIVRGNVLPQRPHKPISILQNIEPLVLEEPFVFLYSGAPNARKGWPRILGAWTHFFDELPWCLLFAKTSQADGNGKMSKMNNVVVDTRQYVMSDINTMLHESHCFVLPSMGEGFGLTQIEALATGLPLITTRWSGHLDFCNDDNCYFTTHVLEKAAQGKSDELMLTAAIADIPSVARNMVKVFRDYDSALAKARCGYDMVRSKFTWGHAAQLLIKNVKELERHR